MALSLEEFSHIVSAIHEAAFDASHWGGALQQLVDALGGRGGALLSTEPRLRSIVSAAVGTDPAAVRAYNDYYGRLDPIAPALERASPGVVLAVHDIVSLDEHRRSEFYNDWAAPLQIGDGLFCGLMRGESGTAWLSIAAPLQSEPFWTPERADLMRLLVPHVQQAVRCQMLVGRQVGELQSALSALDQVNHGVVLLAENGRAVFINAAAHRIFASRDGLLVRGDGSVHAQRASEDTTLRRVIGHCGGGTGDGVRSPGCLTISRPSGQRALVVHVMPVGDGSARFADVRANAMLLIVDLEREARPPLDLMRHLYGLTKAEAAVALGVGRGKGLKQVADDLSISISTARIHLQRAFEKTGTHRQAELVRLLMELDAGVSRDRTVS